MSKVLTISGPTGGSGKSVTALNLSVSLGLYEKKVLLVDCDPQGCVSEWSGVNTTDYPFDLASVLNGKASLMEAISKTEFNNLDILPAGFSLFGVSLKLSRLAANEKILRLLMEEIQMDYDFILLDCPSSYGFLSIAAQTASDWLVAALVPRPNWIKDFYALLKSIQYIRHTHDTPLKIAGILFNRCDATKDFQIGLSHQNLSDTRDLVYATMIPGDRAVEKAIDQKNPLALYDIKSPAAQAYLALAREIISGPNPK
ncbi:MAG: ParA family protein [Desulfobacter sp.]|nr:MAG: ParA family protein [Desulfobacter sp.]